MEKLNQITEQVMEQLKKEGAESSQCRATITEIQEFNVESGKFTLFRTLYDKELYLSMIKQKKHGEITINSFSDSTIKKAIKECTEMTEFSEENEAWEIAPYQGEKEFKKGALVPDLERFFVRVQEFTEYITKKYPLIILEQVIAMYKKSDSVYQDSNGNYFKEEKGYYELDYTLNGKSGEHVSSIVGSRVKFEDLEKPIIESGVDETLFGNIVKSIYTTPLEGKFNGTMVMTPGVLVNFISFLRENYLSDSVILEKTSQWKDKLGKKVADEALTISLKPNDSRIIVGESFTSDGVLSEDCDLIESGILKNFCLKKFAANKTGNKPCPNTSNALIIANGKHSLEEIIKNIKRGIIVGGFSGGIPNASGEFSGVAKNSFLIEDGEIKQALSETMINGNIGKMFEHIEGISKEVQENGYFVLPYIAVSGIVVSGK